MVTCGTYGRRHHLRSADSLSFVQSRLFAVAEEFGWRLQAWAILSNHYHFLASSPEDPNSLRTLLSKLHTTTAIELNRRDDSKGRKVWYQYYDSHITYQKSYLARLKYVHQNPVHHRVTTDAESYPWCSAAWFAAHARPAFLKVIASLRIDRVSVLDSFEAITPLQERESGVEPPHSERGETERGKAASSRRTPKRL